MMRWSHLARLLPLCALSIRAAAAFDLAIAYSPGDSVAISALPFARITQVDYAGAAISREGLVETIDAEDARVLTTMANKAGVNVSLVVSDPAGWPHFSSLSATEPTRQTLISSVAQIASSYRGVALDLPAMLGCHTPGQEDWDNLVVLLERLRVLLDPAKRLSLLVPAAVFPKVAQATALAQVLDGITIMATGMAGPGWTKLTGPSSPLLTCAASISPSSADIAAHAWRAARFPYSKMTLAAATHGYGYSGVARLTKSTRSAFSTYAYNTYKGPFDGMIDEAASACERRLASAGRISFNDLMEGGKLSDSGLHGRSGYRRAWDSCTSSPFLYSTRDKVFIAYEDPHSMRAKAAYVKRMGMAGLSLADIAGDANNLLIDSAYATLQGIARLPSPKKAAARIAAQAAPGPAKLRMINAKKASSNHVVAAHHP